VHDHSYALVLVTCPVTHLIEQGMVTSIFIRCHLCAYYFSFMMGVQMKPVCGIATNMVSYLCSHWCMLDVPAVDRGPCNGTMNEYDSV
jgi:uncharacterized oligopeptide transporter (OPT) family protein